MLAADQSAKLLVAALLAFVSPVATHKASCRPNAAWSQQTAPVERQKPISRAMVPRHPAQYKNQADRALDAAKVLDDTPKWLMNGAEAIAVIAGAKKAAFVFGGAWGKGLISVRDEQGRWLPPAYIEISGGSFGLQLGIQDMDLLLVFADKDAVKSLLKGKLTFNADASAAAGPVGRKAGAGVDVLMSSRMISFSHSKGVFAGVSLNGSVITIDDGSNRKVYGNYINGHEILVDRRVERNDAVAPFMDALERHAPSPVEQVSDPKTTS